MVCRAFPGGLDKQGKLYEVLSVPGRERLQALDAFARRVYLRFRASRDGSHVSGGTSGETPGRELVHTGRLDPLGDGERPAERKGDGYLRRYDESMRIGIAVSTFGEIAVE